VLGQTEANVQDGMDDFVARLKLWLQEKNPEPVFAILRRIDPILIVKNFAVVTRYDDVQEVLSRDNVFHVPYAQKFDELTGGKNFFLGMENTPEYTRDVSTMRLAIRREDIPQRIMPFVEHTADDIVARAGGRIDVVKDLGNIVPSALVAEYIGTPSPTPSEFAEQSAAMSGYLFIPAGSNPDLERQAVADAKVMRAVLARQIAERKRDRGHSDDVLERCLVLQDAGQRGMSDEDILDKLFGIVVAIIPTTSAAFARAIDELLNRPEQLERAQRAARENDFATVWQFMSEAMRFNPLGPGVFRVAATDYTVAAGTSREKTIPQGSIVLAAIQSAMFDSNNIDEPSEFRINRPPYTYMHFGYGLHTCFGQYINAAQLPRMGAALLRRTNLRRAPGAAGHLTVNGAFPTSMTLEYDP
jgi:cytochrome P450